MTARAVDVHALPAMLTALRLPSFHRHWTSLAQCADTEGWPAARFLAALAEVELAERETRRIQRHLAQSRLPGGKTRSAADRSPGPILVPPHPSTSRRRPPCRAPASRRSPPATGP